MAARPYLGADADPTGGPPHRDWEVAVCGRSNAGKSSLINALVGARVARTSSTPGRTQLLHLVRFAPAPVVLVDLPGLGFARAPAPVRAKLRALVRDSVACRDKLIGLLLLVDARRDLGPVEAELLDLARGRSLRVALVATKVDQLPKHRRKLAVAALGRGAGLPQSAVLSTSARERSGLEALAALLGRWAEEAGQPES